MTLSDELRCLLDEYNRVEGSVFDRDVVLAIGQLVCDNQEDIVTALLMKQEGQDR
jgi:hypothetical protein